MPPGPAGPSRSSKHTERRRRPERNKSPAEPPGNAQPLNSAPQGHWTPLPRHRRFERRRCAALVLTHVNPALRHGGRGRPADGSCRHRLVRRRCGRAAQARCPPPPPRRGLAPPPGVRHGPEAAPPAAAPRLLAPVDGLRRRCGCAGSRAPRLGQGGFVALAISTVGRGEAVLRLGFSPAIGTGEGAKTVIVSRPRLDPAEGQICAAGWPPLPGGKMAAGRVHRGASRPGCVVRAGRGAWSLVPF